MEYAFRPGRRTSLPCDIRFRPRAPALLPARIGRGCWGGSPPGMMGGFVITQLYGFSRSTVDIDTLSIVPRDPAAIIRGMGYLPGNELTILRTTYTRSQDRKSTRLNSSH